jgi:hypothetical protein
MQLIITALEGGHTTVADLWGNIQREKSGWAYMAPTDVLPEHWTTYSLGVFMLRMLCPRDCSMSLGEVLALHAKGPLAFMAGFIKSSGTPRSVPDPGWTANIMSALSMGSQRYTLQVFKHSLASSHVPEEFQNGAWRIDDAWRSEVQMQSRGIAAEQQTKVRSHRDDNAAQFKSSAFLWMM